MRNRGPCADRVKDAFVSFHRLAQDAKFPRGIQKFCWQSGEGRSGAAPEHSRGHGESDAIHKVPFRKRPEQRSATFANKLPHPEIISKNLQRGGKVNGLAREKKKVRPAGNPRSEALRHAGCGEHDQRRSSMAEDPSFQVHPARIRNQHAERGG